MPRIKIKGTDILVKKFETLDSMSSVFVDRAVKAGADVVADATRKAIDNLKADNRPYVKDGQRQGLLQVQIDGLKKSFGVTPIQDRKGFINMKTGFDKSSNKLGQRNSMVARRLESGTYYMPKNPIIRKTSNSMKNSAIEAMRKSLNDSLENLTK